MKGRAEYESVKEKELFERKSPLDLFPWPGEDGYDVGLLLGGIGEGKTFFAKKLAEYRPTRIYQLNKDDIAKGKLNYELYEDAPKPKVIVFDDLHHVTRVMRLGYLRGNPLIEEGQVIRIMEGVIGEAKEADAKLIFVSDESPGGLAHNFKVEENKKKFLALLKDATTPDDVSAYLTYFGEVPHVRRNFYWLRSRITNEMSSEMRKEFGMTDIPTTIPILPMFPSELNRSRFSNRELYQRMFNRAQYQMFVPESYEYPELVLRFHEKSKYYDEEWEEIWSPSKCGGYLSEPFKGQRTIALSRELKILSEELGGVNRRTLGIGRGSGGVHEEKRGVLYGIEDVIHVQNVIRQKCSELVKKKLYRSMLPIARALLYGTESESEVAWLEHELSKE